MSRCPVTPLTLLSLSIGVAIASPGAAQAPPVPDWSNPAACREDGKRDFPLSGADVAKKKLVKLLENQAETSIPILWPKAGRDPWTTTCHVQLAKLPPIQHEKCLPNGEIKGNEWLAIRKVGPRYQALLIDGHKTRQIPLELKKTTTHDMWLQTPDNVTSRFKYSIHFANVEEQSTLKKYYVVETYDTDDEECMKNFPTEQLVCADPSSRPGCGPEARSIGGGAFVQGSAGGGHEPPDDPED
jgi:hypothetical protein